MTALTTLEYTFCPLTRMKSCIYDVAKVYVFMVSPSIIDGRGVLIDEDCALARVESR